MPIGTDPLYTTKYGIDVSSYQGEIDWKRVAAAGKKFCMIRAGAGKKEDSRFAANADGAAEAGLEIGAYWFSYALSASDAAEEGKSCVAAIGGRALDYPAAYDYESDSVKYAEANGVTPTSALVTAQASAFCGALTDAGFEAAVYTNPDFLSSYMNIYAVDNATLWLASWSKTLTEPQLGQGIWQYSGSGRVDGIGTAVDLDVSRVDYKVLKARRRIDEIGQVPASLRAETEALIASGALRGSGNGLDVTIDMLRCMIVSKRYSDSLAKK